MFKSPSQWPFNLVWFRLLLGAVFIWGVLSLAQLYHQQFRQGAWSWQLTQPMPNQPRVLAASDRTESEDQRQQRVLAWKDWVRQHPVPQLTARSWLVQDLNLDYTIVSHQPDVPLPPASTTKLMTAWVAVEYYDWNQVLTVPPMQWVGSQMGLEPGEKIPVSNLIYGLLLSSGNDAAEVLAYHYPGGRIGFIKRMNYWVREWKLRSTYFQNPSGLDQEGHYSSARDLSEIAQRVLHHPLLKSVVATTQAELFPAQRGERHYQLNNINDLLSQVPGAYGVKTGFTSEAGEVLISSVRQQGRDLLIVVMGSQDRFGETKALLAWAGLDVNSNALSVSASASADTLQP